MIALIQRVTHAEVRIGSRTSGAIQRDRHGNPTGLLIAKPNALILYATLAKGPTLSLEEQMASTRRRWTKPKPKRHAASTSVAGSGTTVTYKPSDWKL